MKRTLFYILAFALCSCAILRTTTNEEFAKDVQKDLPFKVSEMKAVSGHDNTYSFRSDAYISLLPDYEVDSEGNGRTFGYVYVLQSETARYSDSGTFHWDVSDHRLLLNVSDAVEGMSELSVETLNTFKSYKQSK